ncbi:cuticle protein 10.9-like [Tropilaelaps mercedesae]|uniref:Cuticle protein 10.9-like n=1 Tax=Tropilaelaps mercedesae TaxID=418985 RepID=A0A1V9X0L1_9ACAR|nr:cuticle protein 10.9-like [Tropilaelaps mercedesae]
MSSVHVFWMLSAFVAYVSSGAQEFLGHPHEPQHGDPFVQRINDNVLARLEEAGIFTPYHFQYDVDVTGGSHSREESGDGSGRVSGTYTIRLADGRARTVTYTADERGYRASVITNEMGTESQNPADVTISSSAPTGKEAALSYSSHSHSPTPGHRHEDHHQSNSILRRPVQSRYT